MRPQSKKEVEERLWRVQNLYLIRDKERRLRKLRFNPAQETIVTVVVDCLRRGVPVKHMDLKARQLGVSTFWLLWMLDDTIFTPNTISFVVAQKQETLGLLWDAVRLAYNNMPAAVRPKTREDSARTLTFDAINSTMKVSLSVKSTTLHNLDISEYALCDPDEIEQTLAAAPKSANIVLETVADGVNHACEKWQEKQDGYTKIFHPWYIAPEYRLPVAAPLLRTPEEQRFAAQALRDKGVRIDDEQLCFRREKKKDLKRRFHEQFAEDDASCFLASGQTYFDGRKISVLRKEAAEHAQKYPPLRLDAEWAVWEKPQTRHQYVIGADVAEGVGQDYSVMAVLCVTCRKTAARYRARCGVDAFYRLLHGTGLEYNRALLAWELNNHGHAVGMGLREMNYPNLYRQERKRNGTTLESLKFGWETTGKSKPMMLDDLKVALEGDSDEDESNFEPGLTWLDDDFLKETLDVREIARKISAVGGKHDDMVMAYAIAWQMLRRSVGHSSVSVLGGIKSGGSLESA